MSTSSGTMEARHVSKTQLPRPHARNGAEKAATRAAEHRIGSAELVALKDIRAAGKALRAKVSRAEHGKWKVTGHRADPLEILAASNVGRLPTLVPIRY